MTRPWRRITLHLSQIFLTLGLTFTGAFLLLVPVDDPTAGKVVGGELDDDPVLREDADVVLPHFAADVRQNAVAVGELDAEHGVRQRLDHAPLDLDGAFLLRHVLRSLFDSWRVRACKLLARASQQRSLRQRTLTLKIQDHAVTASCGARHQASCGARHQAEGFSAPSWARRAWPPSRAVRTHGPASVSVNVCSKCALALPSSVTTVQPSSRTRVSREPRLTIGSTASARPFTSSGPRGKRRPT